ncbi:hypothetical protein HK414_07225 [Ramlibacter terrae]|uniref:Uncharacterized protein n=1 Tax=Ramlibacter terrae TaxID=2732511 RepID=A0ABX6P4C9_9BURK|nr:hypothetical protein HK414_07225 [Ramlibacter terrae]
MREAPPARASRASRAISATSMGWPPASGASASSRPSSVTRAMETPPAALPDASRCSRERASSNCTLPVSPVASTGWVRATMSWRPPGAGRLTSMPRRSSAAVTRTPTPPLAAHTTLPSASSRRASVMSSSSESACDHAGSQAPDKSVASVGGGARRPATR